jgi:guanine nucleotide-binding protein G(I)/G(S)/G(T) subunit beta-1
MNSSQDQNDVSPEAMQARIQLARREAETLKDKIKRKKDELADTTRMCFSLLASPILSRS